MGNRRETVTYSNIIVGKQPIALRNVAKFWWPRILAGNQLNCDDFAHFGGKTTVGCDGYRVLWREIDEKQQFAHYAGKQVTPATDGHFMAGK